LGVYPGKSSDPSVCLKKLPCLSHSNKNKLKKIIYKIKIKIIVLVIIRVLCSKTQKKYFMLRIKELQTFMYGNPWKLLSWK
jgi:hypothetical protein